MGIRVRHIDGYFNEIVRIHRECRLSEGHIGRSSDGVSLLGRSGNKPYKSGERGRPRK
jgi:hypothetical protein